MPSRIAVLDITRNRGDRLSRGEIIALHVSILMHFVLHIIVYTMQLPWICTITFRRISTAIAIDGVALAHA